MRPFVILALPRTGTKMLVDAISSHPDIPDITHEFRGTEEEFRQHPYILSNWLEDWMEDVTKIHVYREDAIAGAKSLMMMSYQFPDGVCELPASEVLAVAERRREFDREFSESTQNIFSYEGICGGREISKLPDWFTATFCKIVGVPDGPMTTGSKKPKKFILKNEDEINCLA